MKLKTKMVNKKKQVQSKEKQFEQKICFKCKNIIDPMAKHIDLITWDNKEIVEKIYMHISCWGEYNQDRVNARIKEMANIGLKTLKASMLNSSRFNY